MIICLLGSLGFPAGFRSSSQGQVNSAVAAKEHPRVHLPRIDPQEAVREGAGKFWLKGFSNCNPDVSQLTVAVTPVSTDI
ncbi:unnamed protein product [Nezara viridula]|uniref:Uncharacterized protein n=1 Tax=Nezara viridula TaxID=85310 RepID=A0A9P0H3N9_NEZVI|nr:unnamed protein product [Nezara viridula]